MFRSIGLPELVVVLVAGLLFVPAVLYLRTLQRALERCSPESRTMSPGKVWLLFVPLFNLIWQFLVVTKLAKSLHNEFTRRSLPNSESTLAPGRVVGLAMCISTLVSLVPLIAPVASIAGFVCWIVYWVKIANYSRMLEGPVPIRTN
jgi:hypothetical protein